MKRIIVTEEEVSFSKLIEECEDKDISIKNILQAIDTRFERYDINAQMINESVILLLSCSPDKDDCKDIDKENLEKLLNILNK